MIKFVLLLLCCTAFSCRTTYYIVRHAEKETAATMMADVPLSERGKQQALALENSLQDKNIKQIFSTRYSRTLATAQPLSTATGIRIDTYNAADMGFVTRLKKLKNNVLIVGHSNTVDDLVNALMRKTVLQDLPDSAYGDLFIVTKKSGNYLFQKNRYE